jgi:type II secretory pathway pseudopilin PulG
MLGRAKSAGFVLLDTLIAFAIAAVALTVIFATLPNTTFRQAERLNRHQAAEFAHSVLEEYRATFPEMLRDGEDRSGWSWSIVESDVEHGTGPNVDLIQYVEVTVSAWHRDRPDIRSTTQALIARRRE